MKSSRVTFRDKGHKRKWVPLNKEKMPLEKSCDLNLAKEDYLQVYPKDNLPLLYKKQPGELKYILYSSGLFKRKRGYILGQERFSGCPVNKCYITDNKDKLKNITAWDAILFLSTNAGLYPIAQPNISHLCRGSKCLD